MLKLKAMWCEELTRWKRPWCWERLKVGGEGLKEDEVVGWHHRVNGHEFEWALEVGDKQGSLACCSPWGCIESDMTEWLNWTELKILTSPWQNVFNCHIISWVGREPVLCFGPSGWDGTSAQAVLWSSHAQFYVCRRAHSCRNLWGQNLNIILHICGKLLDVSAKSGQIGNMA